MCQLAPKAWESKHRSIHHFLFAPLSKETKEERIKLQTFKDDIREKGLSKVKASYHYSTSFRFYRCFTAVPNHISEATAPAKRFPSVPNATNGHPQPDDKNQNHVTNKLHFWQDTNKKKVFFMSHFLVCSCRSLCSSGWSDEVGLEGQCLFCWRRRMVGGCCVVVGEPVKGGGFIRPSARVPPLSLCSMLLLTAKGLTGLINGISHTPVHLKEEEPDTNQRHTSKQTVTIMHFPLFCDCESMHVENLF